MQKLSPCLCQPHCERGLTKVLFAGLTQHILRRNFLKHMRAFKSYLLDSYNLKNHEPSKKLAFNCFQLNLEILLKTASYFSLKVCVVKGFNSFSSHVTLNTI